MCFIHSPQSECRRASARKGGGYGRKPSSSSNCSIRAVRGQLCQFELFDLVLLFKFGNRFPVQRFEATLSESAAPSPPKKKTAAVQRLMYTTVHLM